MLLVGRLTVLWAWHLVRPVDVLGPVGILVFLLAAAETPLGGGFGLLEGFGGGCGGGLLEIGGWGVGRGRGDRGPAEGTLESGTERHAGRHQ